MTTPQFDEGQVLLAGIVGSTAYGLNRPGSDVDRLGVYAAATDRLHGLNPPVDRHGSVVTTNPDVTYHEALKFARLCLGCNPTVTELLWLPADLYETTTPLGEDLIAIRSAFLSTRRIRDAYLGYATSQFERLLKRGDRSFSSDLRKRTAKHARHLLRLLDQGLELYSTGQLIVRVADPQRYLDFGEAVAADPDVARPELARAEAEFDRVTPAVPDRPDQESVETWLHRVRAAHYPPLQAAVDKLNGWHRTYGIPLTTAERFL